MIFHCAMSHLKVQGHGILDPARVIKIASNLSQRDHRDRRLVTLLLTSPCFSVTDHAGLGAPTAVVAVSSLSQCGLKSYDAASHRPYSSSSTVCPSPPGTIWSCQ